MGLLVVVLLVVGGIVGVALVAFGSSGELELAIDTCEIAADGALTATGTLDGPSGSGAEVSVQFVDSDTGDLVDESSISLDLGSTTSGGDPWRVTGTAGDEVQRVTCDVTADD